MDLVAIAKQTLEAFERGHYTNADGSIIQLESLRQACVQGSRYFTPDALETLVPEAENSLGAVETTSTMANETTLQAAARLATSQRFARIGILNFASARHPGGGFLSGARAQEETLARSSGLYFSLLAHPDFYDYHRAHRTALYSDRMIYSPACPVIRDDAGAWLDAPYTVDFITSAAPNLGAFQEGETQEHDPKGMKRVATTIETRAGKILALGAHMGCDALILGAWGCGAFRNDPTVVASAFYRYLGPGGVFARRFRHIHWAVYDTRSGGRVYSVFHDRFQEQLKDKR